MIDLPYATLTLDQVEAASISSNVISIMDQLKDTRIANKALRGVVGNLRKAQLELQAQNARLQQQLAIYQRSSPNMPPSYGTPEGAIPLNQVDNDFDPA